MTTAIVFIHRSNSNYLSYTLAQAKYSNPDARVILLGDESNKYESVEHYSIADYSDSASDFAQVYQHLSVNPIEYELLCFQRWFVLKDFIRQQSIQHCLYLDSDVMLYVDVVEEQKRLANYNIALTGYVPGSTYINSLAALEQFCRFITHLYQDPIAFQSIESAFKQKLRNSLATSISDMFAFEEYRRQYPEKVGDLLEIINNSTYDVGMTNPDGYEATLKGIKKINLINGYPYGYLIESSQAIRFNSLHFQGSSKNLIQDFFGGDQKLNHIKPQAASLSTMDQSREVNRISLLSVNPNPESAQEHYDLGVAYLASSHYDEAIRCFRNAISLLPSFLNAYVNLSCTLVQQNQPEVAIQVCQKAIEIAPNNASVWSNLGYAYGQSGDYQQSSLCTAMCNCLETLDLRPDWAETHRNLGLVYQQFGNLEAAITCLERAIELQPDFEEARRDLEAVLELQRDSSRINIFFSPDWQQVDVLYPQLTTIFRSVLVHPDPENITLFIDTSTIFQGSEIDVEEVFNEILFNLLVIEGIEVDKVPGICPINSQSPESQQILSQAQMKVVVSAEDIMRIWA